jgi:DNA-binding GntR family transcriptional regulator
MDDWQDDRSLPGRTEAALLQKAYRRVQARYPEKCAAIEECLRQIGQLEKAGDQSLDGAANLTAQLLGVIYRYKERDYWSETLA